MFGTGVYWYNLHLAFVHADRFRDVRETWLAAIRKTVFGVSAKYKHLLSRGGFLPDHLTLGAHPNESPVEVVLRYMNNLAFASGVRPIYQFGYFAGTLANTI